MPGLDFLYENAFDLGAFRAGAADLEPQGSAYGVTGLLGDDGLPYRRGGSVYKSSAAVGSSGLLWPADAYLAGGRRTFYGNPSATISALGADDQTPATVNSGGPSGPARAAVVAGIAVIPGSAGLLYWAGSRESAGYSWNTGSVTVTAGSRTVTGTGSPAWVANADAGMLLESGGAFQAVESIDTNTQLTLASPWLGDTATGSYFLWQTKVDTSVPATAKVASVANRLLVAAGPRVTFSAALRPLSTAATDVHTFPAQTLAIAPLRDVALVFTNAGAWAISNLAFNLEDASGNPQQRKELVNADLIAWGHEGIAPYSGALVVPALDNVWLMDNLGAPTPIGGRILDLYLSYVRTSGYKPGVAEVFNGHYLLPILDASNVWVDTLVCKLTPSHSGTRFAWTQLAGAGAEVGGFAERSTSPPVLLGASRKAASKLTDVTGYFNPTATVKNDADGTAPTFQLTTRNIPTGGMVKNSVLWIQAFFTLTDAASDDPVVTAEYNADNTGWVSITGNAPEGGPDSPYTWSCPVAARHIRFRFTSTIASSYLKFEALKIAVRKSGLYG